MCVTLQCLCCHVYVKDVVRVSPPSQFSCPAFINKVYKPEKREAVGRTGLLKVVVACLGITVVTGATNPASIFILILQLN